MKEYQVQYRHPADNDVVVTWTGDAMSYLDAYIQVSKHGDPVGPIKCIS